MNGTAHSIRSISSSVLLLLAISAHAATVWDGPTISFTKSNYANPLLAENQDRLAANVWITRGSSQGLFNANTESRFTHFLSPAGTEWANGSLENYATLSYTNWNHWAKGVNPNPYATVGVQAVLHLIPEDIYLSVQFTSWTGGAPGGGPSYGGGFSYLRSTPVPEPQVNYAISGSTAYVTSSPNASGAVVIASIFNGFPVTSIGSGAFQNCTALTSVTIPDSVTGMGIRVFEGCPSLTNLSVDAANPAFSSLNGVVFDKAQTTLVTFPPGRGGSYVIPGSVTSIGYGAFSYGSLTSVTIPDSVTSIGALAFYRGTSLAQLTIGNSVTNIGSSAFVLCTNLTRVTIPDSVTSIEPFAFSNCRSVTNFTFPGNAPHLFFDMETGGGWFAQVGAGARAYYYCGTTGWGTSYGNLPTVMLFAPRVAPGSAGVKPGGFGFTLTCLTNQTVVEASANLVNWQPIWTNSLPGDSADFVDPEWLQHSNRFYRARSD